MPPADLPDRPDAALGPAPAQGPAPGPAQGPAPGPAPGHPAPDLASILARLGLAVDPATAAELERVLPALEAMRRKVGMTLPEGALCEPAIHFAAAVAERP